MVGSRSKLSETTECIVRKGPYGALHMRSMSMNLNLCVLRMLESTFSLGAAH